MLEESGLSVMLCEEAAFPVSYPNNATPTISNDGKTRFELQFSRRPNLSKLRVFVCSANFHIPSKRRA